MLKHEKQYVCLIASWGMETSQRDNERMYSSFLLRQSQAWDLTTQEMRKAEQSRGNTSLKKQGLAGQADSIL